MRINIATTKDRQGRVLALVTDASGTRTAFVCHWEGRSADDSSACWEKFLCAVRRFQSHQVTRRQNLTLRYILFLEQLYVDTFKDTYFPY